MLLWITESSVKSFLKMLVSLKLILRSIVISSLSTRSVTSNVEKCVKGLKNKKGYKLGESVNPKMTKQELIETVVGTERKIVKTIKLKDIK
jgi:hypothetical protein